MSGCAARFACRGGAFASPGWWRLHQSAHRFHTAVKGRDRWGRRQGAEEKGLAGVHESRWCARAGGAQGNSAETRRKLTRNSTETRAKFRQRTGSGIAGCDSVKQLQTLIYFMRFKKRDASGCFYRIAQRAIGVGAQVTLNSLTLNTTTASARQRGALAAPRGWPGLRTRCLHRAACQVPPAAPSVQRPALAITWGLRSRHACQVAFSCTSQLRQACRCVRLRPQHYSCYVEQFEQFLHLV